ncbi:hypothetical protein E2C01_062406 [Portunus trituberculatus]|uniref:Uncharacterized protein n=1 Tax=Portunus trituberculatus TaxID=210409 RepID=A0A5B7HEK9_PORTR|nr:hypothetical protein [Portunus trituberculatus]
MKTPKRRPVKRRQEKLRRPKGDAERKKIFRDKGNKRAAEQVERVTGGLQCIRNHEARVTAERYVTGTRRCVTGRLADA